jgi:hypothetical protein
MLVTSSADYTTSGNKSKSRWSKLPQNDEMGDVTGAVGVLKRWKDGLVALVIGDICSFGKTVKKWKKVLEFDETAAVFMTIQRPTI